MATVIQQRRGTKAQHDDGAGFTGAVGEITVDTTDDTLRVHDGSLKGGHVIAKLSDVEASDTLAELLAKGNATSGTNLQISPSDDLLVSDTSKLKFETDGSNYLQIYKSAGTSGTSYIHEVGGGALVIKGESGYLRNDNDESQVTWNADGVTLGYNGSGVLDTTSAGINVTGEVKGDTLTIDNGSGDTNGYIASSSGATRFTVKSTHDGEVAEEVAGVEIGAKSLSYLDLKTPDTDDYDLRIYHSEPANHSMINSLNEDLFLRSGGKVALQHAGGNTKLETTTQGIDVTGTVTADKVKLGNNEFIELGNNSELKLHFNGTDSYIAETGSGNLRIAADDFRVQNGNATVTLIQANEGGSTALHWGGGTNTGVKLETKQSGVDVSGTVEADAFSGTGNTAITDFVTDVSTSNNDTTVPTTAAVKSYVDNNDGDTTYTGGTGLTLDGTTFNVDAAQTQITSVGTLSGLTTGATTVNGPLIATNDYHQFRSTNTSASKMPLIEVFRDKEITSVGSSVALGGFVFTGLNEDDRKVSYGSFYCAGNNSSDDGEHKASLVFTVADGSGAADPFTDYTNNSFNTGHKIALNIGPDYFTTSGYIKSDTGELKLGPKQAILESPDAYNDQSTYDLHMPNAAKAKVISIGGLGPLDAWITGNQSVAQMLQYRGQHMLMVAGSALEFELPACVASQAISNSTANIGDIWQISNAAGGALTIDTDGSGTAQTVYHFPSGTLTPFTNNPTLAVGGTMMLQAVAANTWMIFNPTGLTDA